MHFIIYLWFIDFDETLNFFFIWPKWIAIKSDIFADVEYFIGLNVDVNKQDNNVRTALMEGNLYCFF